MVYRMVDLEVRGNIIKTLDNFLPEALAEVIAPSLNSATSVAVRSVRRVYNERLKKRTGGLYRSIRGVPAQGHYSHVSLLTYGGRGNMQANILEFGNISARTGGKGIKPRNILGAGVGRVRSNLDRTFVTGVNTTTRTLARKLNRIKGEKF